MDKKISWDCLVILIKMVRNNIGKCAQAMKNELNSFFCLFFIAVDLQGCCPYTRFVVPPKTTHWVAIMQRGKCTFKEKILKAAAFNASAVIIYNNGSKEDTVTMAHEGTLYNLCSYNK